MGTVDLERIDRFAWGVARGFSTRHAAITAGYSPNTRSYYDRLEEEKFIARVDELRGVIKWTQDDPGLMVAELMRCAGKAAALDSAAALEAAHKLIATAARLRQAQPPPLLEPPRPIPTQEEWMALYAPKP